MAIKSNMKKAVQILGVFVLLVLASCSGGLPDLSMIGFNSGAPHGFYGNLGNEYTNLADYERDYMKHADDAEHFRAKARRALRHQDVVPDNPVDQKNLPDFARDELFDAYNMLTDALNTLMVPENESLLAMAQSRYDCWLVHQEDYPTKDAYISCKEGFYDALSLLNVPEDEDVVHSIYFDEGGTELNKEAREKVKEIAARYIDRPQWHIVLKGYTDNKGSKSANKVLSMRRAIAVKNTLGQFGIDLNGIAISAEGETTVVTKEGDDPRESRRVDVKAWPQYVAHSKKNLHVLSGWKHTGDF